MAAPTGFAAQFGFAEESTYGTAVTPPTRFMEFVSESLKNEIERVESKGLRAGRRVLLSSQWGQGKRRIGGDVELEVLSTGQALLWKHMMGTVVTAGASPYTHTCTPGDLTAKSLTLQVGRPDSGGTVRAFTYAGAKIANWELSAAAGEIAALKLGIVGATEDTAAALGSATYAAAMAPLTSVSGTLLVAGAQVDVKEWSLSGNNALADNRWFIRGNGAIKEPLENGVRIYEGSFTADFESLTPYNRFVNGTEASLVLNLAGVSPYAVAITANVRFDGDTPNVSGPEMLELPLKFKCVAPGAADSSAISVVITNLDITP